MSAKASGRERRDRVEALKAEHRQRRRRSALWVGAAVMAAVVLIAGAVWASSRRSGGLTATGDGQIAGLQTFSSLARDHVKGQVSYPQTPPVGGQHSAVWQNCGIYGSPVANEQAVHSLEHAAMWITYRPDLDASQIDAIRSAVAGQRYALVSPYPGLPAPVVATVWGARVRLDSAADPRLQRFINTYKSGSQAPEPRGECTGGVGTPLT